MHWFYTSFMEYAKKQGYAMLREDLRFIEKTLSLLPTHTRRPILYEYCQVWDRAMKKETDKNRAQSSGRRAANQFLLKQTGVFK